MFQKPSNLIVNRIYIYSQKNCLGVPVVYRSPHEDSENLHWVFLHGIPCVAHTDNLFMPIVKKKKDVFYEK